MIEQAIHRLLTDASPVTDLVGNNIYPNAVPATAALPYVVYHRVSSVHQNCMTGSSGIYEARIQIDAWSVAYRVAKQIGEAIRHALHGYTGDIIGIGVRSIRLESDLDFYEPAQSSQDIGTHRISQDYICWTTEMVPAFS
jgi:hypothetical protein